MADYPPIADHGLIGDLQTSALVSLNGTIDWFCSPRFDSPSIFGSILDAEKGGHFTLTVADESAVIKQLYMADTAVLTTRYLTESGVAEVLDFMPIDEPETATDMHRILRIARVMRGEVKFKMECAPAFDYGRKGHHLTLADHHALFVSEDIELSLHTSAMLDHSEGKELTDGTARQEFTLKQGEVSGVLLATGQKGSTAGALPASQIRAHLESTVRYWRKWVSRSNYRGRWREVVNRSALTLKLMTYAPTGALVAAPTTSLPEEMGGERNWDYRYTWVRDGSFSLDALMQLGYTDEAVAFLFWLGQRVLEHHTAEDGFPMNLMYRIDGSSDLVEEIIPDWEGYAGSSPVRVGNGASEQLQLDIYGEALDAVYRIGQHNKLLGHDAWMGISRIVTWLADNWDQPDEGIWEVRGGQQNFVYSRLMCWVAFDRAIRMARDRGFPAQQLRWRQARDAIYYQIMEKGYNEEIGAFTMYYGTEMLDASLLKMPLVGFIAPRDPRWLSTLDVMGREIVSDSLVFRYNPEDTDDGLAGGEGTFSLCTFWYVDALAKAGRVGEARMVFEQMLTYSNHLGLYSEEVGPTGEQLGNFPQAFTHLALISAAVTLNDALDETEDTETLSDLSEGILQLDIT
ncbi:MAG: glycoside hydrolase family 15 protein [Actinomycetia bacterium]|nr:glycoside hydrolase family 15 protein [Actinomycetes bacterium]